MTSTPVRLDDLISHVLEQHPDGGELQHLADAVGTAGHLGEVADHLIGHFVDRARRSGASWTDIGENMGVSKQAAQKRFVPKEATDGDEDELHSRPGLGRLTRRASDVVHHAKDIAQSRGDSHVTAEHLLMGLLDEPKGLALQAISALGVAPEQLRGAVLASLGPACEAGGRPPFSRGAKKTLELSLREALRMGHNFVGTEHMLLALIRNDTEPAQRILTSLGVTMDAAEPWLVDAINARLVEHGVDPVSIAPRQRRRGPTRRR
jgi:hypothetical protein